jgi:hypothetical protein
MSLILSYYTQTNLINITSGAGTAPFSGVTDSVENIGCGSLEAPAPTLESKPKLENRKEVYLTS